MSNIFKDRNKSYIKKIVSRNKLFKHLTSAGYVPDSWVMPPFFEVKNKKTKRKGDGNERNPIYLFAPKSKLKWRAFGFVHPNNYQNVCEILSTKEYYNSLLKLAKPSKIFSYSLPITYKTPAENSGKQISRWNDLQEDLLLYSDQYEYLLVLDIANCYHVMYTHSIEWAFDSVGDKRTGEKIDKAIRSGMGKRTHGLPVGSAATHQIAEPVLLEIDRLIENDAKSIDFIGGRFRDNYYILCKGKQDAEMLLKKMVMVLRKYHLDFNFEKTEIISTKDYFDSFWRIDFNTILSTFGLEATSTIKKMPVRKIEAFIGLSLRLSQKINNERAVIDRVLDILENIEPENDLYPKYFSLIQRMYQIRTQSLPKVLSYLHSLANKNTYCGKRFKVFLVSRLMLAYKAEDVFEISWIIYFLSINKIYNSKVSFYLDKIKKMNDCFLNAICMFYEGIIFNKNLESVDVFSVLWKVDPNTSNLEAKFTKIESSSEAIESLKIKFSY